MRRARAIAFVFLALAGHAARAGLVTNMSPSFRPGPYTCLSIAPGDASHVFVGTSDGHVLWTFDAGATVSEARVVSGREYLSAPLRTQAPLIDLIAELESDRSKYSGLNGEPPGTRLFLYLLKEGIPVVKWQYWMSIENPETEIADVAAFAPDGPGFAATAAGLFFADARRAAWSSVVGEPRPRPRELNAYAVTIDPSDPARVLAGTSEGLLESSNGGRTFHRHHDRRLADEDVRRFVRDPEDPAHLLAVTDGALLQSKDGGRTFETAFSTKDTIHTVALGADGAYVATSNGLLIPGEGDAVVRRYAGQSIVGVVPLERGWFMAATPEAVYLHADGADLRVVETSGADPILRLEGDGRSAWALTRYGVYRVDGEPTARAARVADPPRMLLSAVEAERAVRKKTGAGDPVQTRLGRSRASYLMPTLTLSAESAVSHDFTTAYDATFPIGPRMQTWAGASSCCGAAPGQAPAQVMALLTWDLSGLLTKKQPTAPWGMIEMNLRAMHEQLLGELRWRYRDAAALAHLLATPPADARTRWLWRQRLEEHAAYLEQLCGRPVIDLGGGDQDGGGVE
jgi:hypothetical protein